MSCWEDAAATKVDELAETGVAEVDEDDDDEA